MSLPKHPQWNFHVISGPDDPRFDEVFAVYEKCFPLEGEAEGKEDFLEILRRNDDPELKANVKHGKETWIYATDPQTGQVIGATNIDIFANVPPIGRIDGTIQDIYTFVEEPYRQKGVFDALIAAREAMATDYIQQANPELKGKPPTLITFAEQNDPLQMTKEEYLDDLASGIDPVVRRDIYEKRGFRTIGMPYIQPALGDDGEACEYLNLVARGAEGKSVASAVVRQHLKNFFELSFGGVKLDDPSITSTIASLDANNQLQLMETGRFKQLQNGVNGETVEAAQLEDGQPLRHAFPKVAAHHYRGGFAEAMGLNARDNENLLPIQKQQGDVGRLLINMQSLLRQQGNALTGDARSALEAGVRSLLGGQMPTAETLQIFNNLQLNTGKAQSGAAASRY